MAHARLWWSVALFAVPAVLAGLALLWTGPPTPVAPPVASAGVPPAAPASVPPAVSASAPAPVVAADPTPPEPPDTARTQLAAALATQPIRFPADSAELEGPAVDTVRRVAELLVTAPEVSVVVEGHVADTPGGPEAVQQLSDRRAAIVAEALVAAGVPAERITARGVGVTRPLATVEESRRVEITVG